MFELQLAGARISFGLVVVDMQNEYGRELTPAEIGNEHTTLSRNYS